MRLDVNLVRVNDDFVPSFPRRWEGRKEETLEHSSAK